MLQKFDNKRTNESEGRHSGHDIVDLKQSARDAGVCDHDLVDVLHHLTYGLAHLITYRPCYASMGRSSRDTEYVLVVINSFRLLTILL
jgi:hypothetical protein